MWDVGIAVRETDRQLGYAVEAVLDDMIRGGQMKQIFERYGVRFSAPSFYQVEQAAQTQAQ
jgi:hypothetical protein